MPARDKHHDVVRNALVKDGWTITDDPLRLRRDRIILACRSPDMRALTEYAVA